jgi:hypothetical protein
MSRGWFVAWLTLIAAVILAVVAANGMRGGKSPLLVDASFPTESRRFMPCPVGPRAIARKSERIA